MSSEELREKFLKFFEERGHKILPSASLVPQDDPSVLLTTAGMQQFKGWFSGVEKPIYPRVVTVQKCVRIGDIEEVGDNTHLSFFEMLGNFSFGDYFKEEAIKWGLDFVCNELKISFDRLNFTYFKGDHKTSQDKESFEVLRKLNVPRGRIKGMGREDNFWGPTGDEGPCGPTVEIYVDGLEVWNLVFNEYYKTKEGEYLLLEPKGVDTGIGLERLLGVLNAKKNVYETDLFRNILLKIDLLAKVNDERSKRVMADHLRAATFLIADGVFPSNLDRGYVLRRLIRRAIRYGRILKIEQHFCSDIAKEVIEKFKSVYPELLENKQRIFDVLRSEEEKFEKTLDKGIRQFETFIKGRKEINGRDAFYLFQTYGFPLEMTTELAKEKGIRVDKKGFQREFERHQALSRTGAEKKFKGGLATGGEIETKYHTATHLLHQALKIVLGDHIKQAGSNITAERLRFDFTHPEKMTPEEITAVEGIVNSKIREGLEVKCEEMPLKEAKKLGAVGIFDKKYGERVKVYFIGDFSIEICGGPHVKNTKELGEFKIIKEESSSAGVRRVKAILR